MMILDCQGQMQLAKVETALPMQIIILLGVEGERH
jgi:hypothetical protein